MNRSVFCYGFLAILIGLVLLIVPSSVWAKSSSGGIISSLDFKMETSGTASAPPSSNSQSPQTYKPEVTGLSPSGSSSSPSASRSHNNTTQTLPPPIINCPTGEAVSDFSQCSTLSLPSSSSNNSTNIQTTPNLGKQVQDWLKTNVYNATLTVKNGTLNSVVISFNDSRPSYVKSSLSEIEQLEVALNLHMRGPEVDDGDATVLVLGRNP
ncbi:hypothetical protein [Nitrososphaera sp. AFS]|uniref:hypothetical protein n=1 Tax=Nitrososphaera sp. AFS TaxID=2301191 RepID=UPI00139230AA|nr:hypothetical protein [Nitrososphaera sp. AFS]